MPTTATDGFVDDPAVDETVTTAGTVALDLLPDTAPVALLALVGSRAYGTARPTSDVDLRGVYTAPSRDLLAGRPYADQHQLEQPDVTVYELGKFIRLATAANPNILEVLHAPAVHTTQAGRLLTGHRSLFCTAAAHAAYRGFAVSQIRKFHTLTVRPGTDPARRHKHVLHALRLCDAGVHLARTGTVQVAHPDPDLLGHLARRRDLLVDRDLHRALDRLDDAFASTDLPAGPGHDRIAELQYQIRRAVHPDD